MKIKSVMIIDDSESDQFLAEAVVSTYDPEINIHQAYDGQEALDMLAEMAEQPSLIFVDINMPGMDGFEFLKHYCQRAERGELISMLTSSDLPSDMERALEESCSYHYLVKPLKYENLTELENVVSEKN